MDDLEWEAFLERVALSGHQRQDFLIKSVLYQEIIVIGNGALFKKLDSSLDGLVSELKRIGGLTPEDALPLLRLKTIIEILDRLRHGKHSDALDGFLRDNVLKL
jgi:hypothetical protein